MRNAMLEAMPLRSGEREALLRLPDELEAARARRDAELDLPRRFLAEVMTFPAAARAYWQRIIREPAGELHAARDQVVAEFEKLIDIARLTAGAMPKAEALAGGPLPGSELLPAARQDLSRFVELVLTRWKTQEDLEELIVDTFELPEWLTKGPIPEHLRPPPSWYQETIDPFQPAKG